MNSSEVETKLYKLKIRHNKMKKRGQVTIFIIIALIIILFAVLIYLFYPTISTTLGYGSKSPSEEIQDCIEPSIAKAVKEISSNGGSINPEFYYEYLQALKLGDLLPADENTAKIAGVKFNKKNKE